MSAAFHAALDATPDPIAAHRAWQRILASWTRDQPFPDDLLARLAGVQPALAHLLAVSPISTDKLARDFATLAWLADPAVVHAAPRSAGAMRASLSQLGWRLPAPDAPTLKPAAFTPLRRWKQRETLRIALRDVGGLARVEETMQELTFVAEICLREILAAWRAELARRHGNPATQFCVLGMGKLGGGELNFSSDIDLVFFYGEPGELPGGLTCQQFFTRLAQALCETFAAADPAGALFRVDLRLRPEGDAGPLVRSLDGLENYYAAFGETWERMALGKARLVAGDEELAYEFSQRHQAFIYPRSVGAELLDEMAQIKARIEREVVGTENLHRNVKLGHGGIREIEFIAQTFQLLHGARHPFLQERSTLRLLQELSQLDLLARAEARSLAAAYRFLRVVEHRLQIAEEAQTHTLPAEPDALARLSESLSQSGISTDFQTELAHHTSVVRAIFERVMTRNPAPEPPPVDLSVFAHPDAAARDLAAVGEGGSGGAMLAPRTKKLFAQLQTPLLAELRKVADPDAALARFVRFAERYSLRGALFETLLANPRVLGLLVRLFDASPFLSEISIRRPQLVEEVARLGDLGMPRDAQAHLALLKRNDEGLKWPEWLRVYRWAQQLRIGLRDLLGFADPIDVWLECSMLADACLTYAYRQLDLFGQLTVVALGKYGGFEIGYGADLDLLFIGHDSAAAAALIGALTETTAEGRVYPVDARLRPEGEKGQLAITYEEWCDYFERGRGSLWEVQALTKARPIVGHECNLWAGAAQRLWREFGARPGVTRSIQAMLERVFVERGGDPVLDLKTTPGGLMQLEFYVQARQMAVQLWEPTFLQALFRLQLGEEKTAALKGAYFFLRQIETVLRRENDLSVSSIPADSESQRRLAHRCGLDLEAFRARLRATRETIRREANLRNLQEE